MKNKKLTDEIKQPEVDIGRPNAAAAISGRSYCDN
jgi:hypothetical protein